MTIKNNIESLIDFAHKTFKDDGTKKFFIGVLYVEIISNIWYNICRYWGDCNAKKQTWDY